MTSTDIAMAGKLMKEFVVRVKDLKRRRPMPEGTEEEKLQAEADRAEIQRVVGKTEQEIIARILAELEPSTRAAYQSLAGEPGGVSRFELQRAFKVEPVVRREAP